MCIYTLEGLTFFSLRNFHTFRIIDCQAQSVQQKYSIQIIGWNVQYNSREYTVTRDTCLNGNKCSRSIKPYCNKPEHWTQSEKDEKISEQRAQMLKYTGSFYSNFSPESLLPLESQEIWTAARHLELSFCFTGTGVWLLFPDLSHCTFAWMGARKRPRLADLTFPDLYGQTAWDKRPCL